MSPDTQCPQPEVNWIQLTANVGFPGGSDGKESACNARDLDLMPRLQEIPWSRAWQPTPAFLPEESPWTEKPGRQLSMESQRVRHDSTEPLSNICHLANIGFQIYSFLKEAWL